MRSFRLFSLLLPLCLLGGAGGCASSTAVSSGHNTALDSMDLQTMTDQMAASLAGNKKVSAAFA
ncbi:MAG TPA: hypothetical protein VF796_25530, partial [Humisphaera sp.]